MTCFGQRDMSKHHTSRETIQEVVALIQIKDDGSLDLGGSSGDGEYVIRFWMYSEGKNLQSLLTSEEKKKDKNDSKALGLSTWKDGVTITKREACRR